MTMPSAFVMILTSVLSIYGCSSPTELLTNRQPEPVPETTTRSEPLEVRCSAGQASDGHTVLHYHARNIGQKTIYITDGRRMPYELVRDDILVILQGVNAPEPDRMYEVYSIPGTKPLMPGGVFRGEAELGRTILRGHFRDTPAPATFLHGRIRVACAVGWGETPIAEPDRMPFDEFLKWQHLTNYGPFEVILP